MNFKQALTNSISFLDDKADAVVNTIRRKRKKPVDLELCGYRSFGCDHTIYVHGRLLQASRIKKAGINDSLWRNLINMYQRFRSREVGGAEIEIEYGSSKVNCITNHEGYFNAEIKIAGELPKSETWVVAKLKLLSAPVRVKMPIESAAEIYIPSANAQFGIISDIDDTIIESFATNKFKMFRTVVFKNSRTRSPFEGVSAFYKALQRGKDADRNNPIFYVSSSPWNLYDFLIDFLVFREIPYGPLLLRDAGVDKEGLGGKNHLSHKFEHIEKIFATYPDLPFILIGDSGQKDPMIYSKAVDTFPNRILAIYIRDVKLPEKAEVVQKLSQELTLKKVPMVLVENTTKAAEHALEHGWISHDWLKPIKTEAAADQQADDSAAAQGSIAEVAKDAAEQVEAAPGSTTVTGTEIKSDTLRST